MATSPNYTSTTNLSLPKKRSTLNTHIPPAAKRRKHSSAGPSHLRQTSFPPEYNPTSPAAQTPRYSRSPSVESSILGGVTPSVRSGVEGSVFGGSTTGTTGPKKRGRKKKGVAIDEQSIVSGKGGGKGSGTGMAAGSLINGSDARGQNADDLPDEEDQEDDDDAHDANAMVEGGKMDEAALRQQKENLALLISSFTEEQSERYDMYRRVRLRKENVRRLTNHTLSQSAPASIVTSISGFSKIFLGELIERARDVQVEWLAAGERAERKKNEKERGKENVAGGDVDVEAQKKGRVELDQETLKGRTKEADRGPLRPDHLREALRRYKMDREGGAAGFLGLSMEGTVQAAPRMGGRRLFR